MACQGLTGNCLRYTHLAYVIHLWEELCPFATPSDYRRLVSQVLIALLFMIPRLFIWLEVIFCYLAEQHTFLP